MSDDQKSRGKRIEKLQIMVADSEIEEIDDWRFSSRSPSRAAAIRRLIQLGMHFWENHQDEALEVLKSSDTD